jgi:hypothetical protein
MLCKLVDGQLKVAGGRILVSGDLIVSNPREEDFINAGYKPVEDNRLEEKEGYYQVPEYTEEEDKIVINYHYEEIPEEPEEV